MTMHGKKTPLAERLAEGTMNERMTYRLLIRGRSINGDLLSCTGEQARLLINDLAPWTENCRWFLVDVKTNNIIEALVSCHGKITSMSIDELQNLCIQSDQFLSGIFLALPQDLEIPQQYHDMITEDEPTMDIGGAVAELRAMDTSYFEIYVANPEIRDALQKKYNCSIPEPRD